MLKQSGFRLLQFARVSTRVKVRHEYPPSVVKTRLSPVCMLERPLRLLPLFHVADFWALIIVPYEDHQLT